MRVKVGGKVIPASYLKVEGRGARWGERPEREGQIEESIFGQNLGSEAPPKEQERAREEGAKEMLGEELVIRVGIKRRKRGSRKFREG